MKIRRFVSALLAVCLLLSTVSLTAMAKDNVDTKYKFYFSDEEGRIDHSTPRAKEDTSPIYFRTEYGTLPYKGYCISAYSYWPSSTTHPSWQAYSSTYLINDYREYLLRCDLQQVHETCLIILQGEYPFTTYSWGDVTIWWSPDSVDTGGLVTLDPSLVNPVDPSQLS